MPVKDQEEANIYVSIILPSLNSVAYIKECMESILKQTMSEVEILCIDAGSTDGTLEIIEAFAIEDDRVRIICSDKRSYGYQVNLGIHAAKGRYIGIVESDDYIDSALFHTLYTYAERNRFPDFVKGGFQQFMEWEGNRFFEPYNRDSLKCMCGNVIELNQEREKGVLDLNHIWSGIYKRSFLLQKDIKLNESPGASYQDLGFSLLVGLLADTGIFVDENQYYYRIDNAESSVKSSKKWNCVINEFHYVMQELKKRALDTWERKKLVWTQKPEIYFWNILRLPKKEGKLFFGQIQDEVLEYKRNPEFYDSLNADQRMMLSILSDEKKFEDYSEKRNKAYDEYKRLIELIRKGKKFVLISAGTYGEQMILLQDRISKQYIEAVADNNKGRQGCTWNQYVILSVPDVMVEYTEDYFLVANKRNADFIRDQIIKHGIDEEKILVFNHILSITEVMQVYQNGTGESGR